METDSCPASTPARAARFSRQRCGPALSALPTLQSHLLPVLTMPSRLRRVQLSETLAAAPGGTLIGTQKLVRSSSMPLAREAPPLNPVTRALNPSPDARGRVTTGGQMSTSGSTTPSRRQILPPMQASQGHTQAAGGRGRGDRDDPGDGRRRRGRDLPVGSADRSTPGRRQAR